MIKIWAFITISVMCSCSSKPSNEMADIIQNVLKEDQGITLDFQPHPKVK